MARPTKHITLVMSVIAAGAWAENRFVNFANTQAGEGEAILGVSPYAADTGDVAAVEVQGITIVEAGGIVAVGDKVTPDAQGLAITPAPGQEAAGTALDAATQVGDLIRVLLKG